MILNNQTITIFGGTGFVGRYIIRVLAKTGARINVLSRSPNEYSFLKTAGSLGQISFFQGSIKDHDLIEELIAKSDVVINAVGILFEKKGQSFIEVHSDFPEFIAKMAYKYQIKKLLHISALGIDEAINSKYAASKLKGEALLKENFDKVTILRPSVIFGEEDQFFNKFAQLTSFSPFLPLIEQGKTRFQPVYVADVSRAIYNIMVYEGYDNKTYELGGPDIYSFKEIYEYILKVLGRKRFLIKLPNFVAKIMALIFELMPTPMLTIDQLKLLKTDNITKKKVNSFFHLQIQPYKIEEIVPKYLQMYKSDCYHRKDNNN
jgi:uncharacterized protein YbjT (DUF2867 family)